MFTILIVEDELLIAEMLRDVLSDFGYTVLDSVTDVDAACDFIQHQTKPDLAIIDINLQSEKTGLDLAKILYEQFKVPFVFLTSYADSSTIKEALKLNPEAYLLKPFKSTDIYTTIEIIRNKNSWQPKDNNIVIIKDGAQILKIDTNEILWLKSDNVYVEVKLLNKKLLLRKSLDGLLSELNVDHIIRSHRSYAVNLFHVKAISGFNLQLGEDIVPLSRMHKEGLVEKFRILKQK